MVRVLIDYRPRNTTSRTIPCSRPGLRSMEEGAGLGSRGDVLMSSIDAAAASQGQVGVQIATYVLKQANEQQTQILKLLESAVEGIKSASEPGKGMHLDTQA